MQEVLRQGHKINKTNPKNGEQTICFCFHNLGLLVKLQAPKARDLSHFVPFWIPTAAELLHSLIPSDGLFYNTGRQLPVWLKEGQT